MRRGSSSTTIVFGSIERMPASAPRTNAGPSASLPAERRKKIRQPGPNSTASASSRFACPRQNIQRSGPSGCASTRIALEAAPEKIGILVCLPTPTPTTKAAATAHHGARPNRAMTRAGLVVGAPP